MNTTIMPILSPITLYYYEEFLRERYKSGPFSYPSKMGAAREFGETVTNGLSHLIKKAGSPVRVSIETDHSRYMPSALTGGSGLVRSLVIYNGSETFTRQMTISPTGIRLNGRPVFIDHPEGGPVFLHAVIGEVETVIRGGHTEKLVGSRVGSGRF